jgi:Na+-driven multidrug efflux pump
MPFMMLNAAFRPLLITADRSDIGLAVSITNAVINIVLDWIAVAILGWGLTGAAMATGFAWIISFMIPLFWFMNRKNPLHFGPFRTNWRELGKTCYNGGSEMTTAISYALIAMLYNGQLMRYAQESGVDAYAVSAYVNGIYMAVFFGIAMSINPVVGYHLGQGSIEELRSIRKNGLILMSILGISMSLLSFFLAGQFARFFVGYDKGLTELAVSALRIICLAYILGGITTFFSSFFTGMGDGTGSLAVAVTKSFIIPFAGLIILPLFLGTTGIWIVSPIAETVAFGVVLFVFMKYKKKGIL